MAADVQKRRYATEGSVAYAPGYDGGVIRRPARGETLQPQPRTRPRERVQARPRVRVREQGKISVFAIAGFLAAGIFAALVLMSYVNLTTLYDETVTLRGQLLQLQEEEAKLTARYELAYDPQAIAEAMTAGGVMAKAQSSQIYTIDLSEPDSVVRYEESSPLEGIRGAAAATQEVFLTIVEYFR